MTQIAAEKYQINMKIKHTSTFKKYSSGTRDIIKVTLYSKKIIVENNRIEGKP